jgi:hypothetical protein
MPRRVPGRIASERLSRHRRLPREAMAHAKGTQLPISHPGRSASPGPAGTNDTCRPSRFADVSVMARDLAIGAAYSSDGCLFPELDNQPETDIVGSGADRLVDSASITPEAPSPPGHGTKTGPREPPSSATTSADRASWLWAIVRLLSSPLLMNSLRIPRWPYHVTDPALLTPLHGTLPR